MNRLTEEEDSGPVPSHPRQALEDKWPSWVQACMSKAGDFGNNVRLDQGARLSPSTHSIPSSHKTLGWPSQDECWEEVSKVRKPSLCRRPSLFSKAQKNKNLPSLEEDK